MTTRRSNLNRPARARVGGLLSAEMLMIMPVLVLGIMGLMQTSLTISANHRLQLAASTGCRVASVAKGASEPAVQAACRKVLGPRLAKHARVRVLDSGRSGTMCRVTVAINKKKAVPDLLGFLGMKHEGTFVATTTMRKE